MSTNLVTTFGTKLMVYNDVLPIVALLTPGTASNAPDDVADNADSAFPAEGMMNDDPGCYSDDDMGPAGGGFSQSLASPAKKTATEVCRHD